MPHDLEQLGSNGFAKDEPSKEIKRRENRGEKGFREEHEQNANHNHEFATVWLPHATTVRLRSHFLKISSTQRYGSLRISASYSRGLGEQETLEAKSK